ncbi:MAG: endonuclease/exonuclease/phosphatase family protein [Kluyvera sp.]|uniref:tail fiber/spike domain-containing protein n=1 Tax=Kluyvera sp. TaxID=1538228 RepID=UPI003F2A19DA
MAEQKVKLTQLPQATDTVDSARLLVNQNETDQQLPVTHFLRAKNNLADVDDAQQVRANIDVPSVGDVDNKLEGFVDGKYTFSGGGSLASRNDFIWDEDTKGWYFWSGTLPKDVPASSSPDDTGGIGEGAWKNLGDIGVRRDISITDYSGVNVIDATISRVNALALSVIRFCTWNIQNGYPIFVYYDDPDGGDARRFNRDEDSPLYMSEINEHLLRMGIDIVGFQEVIHRWDAPISLRALYPYADAAEGRTDQDANGVTVNRVYSNAVMSTKSIASSSNTVLAPRVGTTDGNSLIKTVINWNGTEISMYNVHLAASDDATRLAQLDTVAGILNADTNTHIVLTGDFNLHLDSQFTALTSIGFNMVNNENGPNTYNGTKGWVWHMDRIFHKGFSAQGSWGVDEDTPRELGDHKPVWVDLTI